MEKEKNELYQTFSLAFKTNFVRCLSLSVLFLPSFPPAAGRNLTTAEETKIIVSLEHTQCLYRNSEEKKHSRSHNWGEFRVSGKVNFCLTFSQARCSLFNISEIIAFALPICNGKQSAFIPGKRLPYPS